MQLAQVLDVVEGLLVASRHPDIVKVERYGTATEPWGPNVAKSKTSLISGVRVTYVATSTAVLWGAVKSDTIPVQAPAEMPPPTLRAFRLPIFVAQLLDVARPAAFTSWQLVAQPTMGPKDRLGELPSGLNIACADGTRILLLSTATGAMVGSYPEQEQFPDYVIPDGLQAAGITR